MPLLPPVRAGREWVCGGLSHPCRRGGKNGAPGVGGPRTTSFLAIGVHLEQRLSASRKDLRLKVLYHPHFEPNLSWLRSSLLVYDTVCSIVPTGASYHPSSSMERHLDAMPGTFETIAPERLDIVNESGVLNALEQAFQ